MKKLDIGKSFKSKQSKYGGYATLMTAVVLAILLVVNLIATSLDIKVDMTKNKLYSLSQESYNIIDSLKQDVKVYAFFETGNEDPVTTAILDQYTARSNKITLEYKDPVRYPEYAKKYASGTNTVQAGSIVVECGSRFKLLSYYDLVNMSYDYYGNVQQDSVAAEQAVTNAIVYVTSEKNPTMYTLQGHGETALPSDISKQLSNHNYTIKDINLLLGDTKLQKGDTLFVMSPTRDISADESAQIREFMANGGRAIFLLGINSESLPNLEGLLNSYGVGIQKAIVIEGNPKYRASQYANYLFPEMSDHDILAPLNSSNLPVLIPNGQGIETLKVKKSSIKVEPLLTTSSNSWGKVNLEFTTAEKEAGDLTGPFDLAVAVTDTVDGIDLTKDAKLVVVGSAAFTDPQISSNGGNIDFVVNSVNWLQDKTDSISVMPKSLDTEVIQINALQALIYSGVVVILIPLIIIALGVRVWLRRRHQ